MMLTEKLKWLLGSNSLIKLLPFLFLFGDACIEPLEIEVAYLTPRFVVDGEISNEPGPYEVKLFYTTAIDSPLVYTTYETGALVRIVDDEGDEEPLNEVQPGIYRTSPASSFQGQVGKSYYLSITLQNGEELISSTQEIREFVPIVEMITEFEDDAIVLGGNTEDQPLDAFRIYLRSSRPVTRDDHVLWRSHGTFKARTHPELAYAYGLRGELLAVPPTCSGWFRNGNILEQLAPCSCCICWGHEPNEKVLLSDDLPGNTQNVVKVPVATIPVTGLRFSDKYHIRIDQVSVSDEVYQFWKLVKAQQESGGNIFQPNSVKVRGNIRSITNPDREILGIFSAAGISSVSTFLYPSDVPGPIPTSDVVRDDCRNGLPNGSIEKPTYW